MMNKKTTSQLKDYILIVMGLVISIAGIIYIIVQYTKLLSAPSPEDEESDRAERFDKKLRSHFKQIHKEEGISPEQMDEGDLAIELE